MAVKGRTNYQDWECWSTKEFQGSAITARIVLKAPICGSGGAPEVLEGRGQMGVVFLTRAGMIYFLSFYKYLLIIHKRQVKSKGGA